jgi:hypothetical protein
MQAESLEVLERADLAPAQARAIVRAIEIEINGAKDALATKHDVLLLRHEISELRTELQASLRTETADVRRDMSVLGASLRKEMSDLRAEQRAEMSELRGELRTDIRASASSITRQMYGALLGQMAVLLGFAYFFATHIR